MNFFQWLFGIKPKKKEQPKKKHDSRKMHDSDLFNVHYLDKEEKKIRPVITDVETSQRFIVSDDQGYLDVTPVPETSGDFDGFGGGSGGGGGATTSWADDSSSSFDSGSCDSGGGDGGGGCD